MKDPLFTVVVPTFERPAYLPESLASVAGQTVSDLECLVVNDGGKWASALPDRRFRLISRSSRGGPAAARNSALQQARGTYISFLDDDDLYVPHRLELALEGLKRAPVSICWSTRLGDAHSTSAGRSLEGDVSDTILDRTTPHLGATAVVRTHALSFNERFRAAEDLEWWLRTAQSAQVSTVSEIGHIYRAHQGVRPDDTVRVRIRCSLCLLRLHQEYFARHRKAAAFRWKRIAILRAQGGNRSEARSALWKSFRLNPSIRTLSRFARPPVMPISVDRR